jgi:replication factor C subunit 3/5
MACDVVDEKGVYLTTGNPLPSDIESVVNWLLNEEFTTAFQSGWCLVPLRSISTCSTLWQLMGC